MTSTKAKMSTPKIKTKRQDSKGIESTKKVLNFFGINYEVEKTFEGLKYINKLRLDIFFEKEGKKFAIEFDGKDHFSPRFKSEKCVQNCKTQYLRDRCKDDFCSKNCVHLLRIAYTKEKLIPRVVNAFINESKNFPKNGGIIWYADKETYKNRGVNITESHPLNGIEIGVVKFKARCCLVRAIKYVLFNIGWGV